MSAFIAITGPTAVGKTDLAIQIAKQINAEIVSVDSRQIYRGLNIGTAKPSPWQLEQVSHHFIDERELSEPINAGLFGAEASDRVDAILARGRVPLAVGGSTLYLMALVHGLPMLPPVPEDIAAAVAEQALTEQGRNALYAELARADPKAATTLDPSKTSRLVRWVGVLRATDAPPSAAWDTPPNPRHRFQVVVLDRPRHDLYHRVEKRVDAMLDAGLVDENRRLLDQGVDLASPPLKTIGYQEPLAFLQNEIDKPEMIRLLKRNTRRYAKRQLTWFRRYPSYRWIDAESATVQSVLDLVG